MPQPRVNNLYQVPEVIDPPTTLCLEMQIPNDDTHIANMQGALFSLCAARAYMDKPGVRALDIANVWRKLMGTIKITDCAGNIVPVLSDLDLGGDMSDVCDLLRYHNGRLQGFCCGQWQDIGSDDGTAPNGTGGQPGGGQPQPQPGGCQQYNGNFNANSQFLVPTVVNAGDTITMNSASGAGQGGSIANWYCVDGSQFFAGACVGFPTTSGGDPAPALNHGMLIASIAGVWYSFKPGDTIVVPGGVSNAPVYVQANFPLSGASGSYTIAMSVCNNQAASWCKVYDFSVSNYGWSVTTVGSWISGTGFVGAFFDGSNQTLVNIGLNYASTTITEAQMTWTKSAGSGANDVSVIYNGNPLVTDLAHDIGGHGADLVLSYAGGVASTGMNLTVNAGTTAGATVIISKLILRGTGTAPAGGVDC